jgi:small subunit ribosomal protein S4
MLKGERCATPKCALERKGLPPGQRALRRRKISDRGLQLREKQKARYTYGILERQFRKLFREAERRPGVTGEIFLQLLERRLDNVVYRLGFADSRSQARQIVRHGHIKVNGRKVNIPSYLVKSGDVISWNERSTKTGLYLQAVEKLPGKIIPSWLNLDRSTLSGRVMSLPTPNEIEAKFDEKLIIEYYAR